MKLPTALAFYLACVSTTCNSQALWQNTNKGMSPPEVISAVPGAESHSPNDKQKLRSGATLRAKLDNLEIVGLQFTAGFYFAEEKLEQVNLSSTTNGDSSYCSAKYRALYEALKSKYGNELSKSRRIIGSSEFYDFSWAQGQTSIKTSMLSLSGSCSIYVFYSSEISESASKL